MFRLGKTTRSHSTFSQARPRPVLIKLSVAWDRKLVLLRKRKLNDFRIERLFVREDLPIELRQHKALKISQQMLKLVVTNQVKLLCLISSMVVCLLREGL